MPRLAAFPKGFFDALIARRMTVFDWIDIAGRLELEGAELGPKFLDSYDSAYLARVRKEAAARGLELPMLCHSPDFTQADPADRHREVEHTREIFRVTAELGGKYCRVLSGQNRPGLKEDEALRIVDTWLATSFAGGRHERRVEKIAAMESKAPPAARKS